MAEHSEFPSATLNRPITVAQLSDPHLTSPAPDDWRDLGLKRLLSWISWRRKRRYRHQAGILAQVVADLRGCRPDHLLVTGDLTHLGLDGECREGLAWLEALGDPRQVAVIPGNHDCLVADDWNKTVGQWQAYFASFPDAVPRQDAVVVAPRDRDFPIVRRLGAVALVGLNTAVPTPPLLAGGRLGATQRGRLARLLDELGQQGLFRLVFLHHSPLPGGHAWRKRLRDADALLEVLRAAGAELVVHGHGHHEALATVATTAGPMLVVGAPSASLAGDDQAGWNLYRIEAVSSGWTVTVERHRHCAGAMACQNRSEYVLPRSRPTHAG